MEKFEGVPAGRVAFTPLPNLIFTELLPEIDDAAELQVTLHIFYLLFHKKGSPRYVTMDELRESSALQRALSRLGPDREETLQRGLGLAEARGTLLHATAGEADWYFFNTAESRKALERLERGELRVNGPVRRAETRPLEMPNIYKLYEQNIGMLTPMIAEELKLAEQEYPPQVILDAFRIANENNVRKWSYVRAILEDWTREGKHEETRRYPARKRKPFVQGEFADTVKRRKG